MKITMIGSGYVGLVSVLLARALRRRHERLGLVGAKA